MKSEEAPSTSKKNSPFTDLDPEQRKFAILVALAFLIILLGWLATWQWQSGARKQNELPARSFFQNTTDYTKPGIDSLKNTTNTIFRRNNSQDQ